MAEPRKIGTRDNLPTGSSVDSDAGVDGTFSRVDHTHLLWTPWTQLEASQTPNGGDWYYSLCPPLVQWSFNVNVTGPVVNPFVTGNLYAPDNDVVALSVNGLWRFRSNGEIRFVDYDMTDPNGMAGSASIRVYHFTYRYDG